MTDKILPSDFSAGPAAFSERTDAPDKMSKAFIFRYMLATLGLFTGLMTPVTLSLAIKVSAIAPADKNAFLGWILGSGALVATLSNPIAGMLSDRIRSRFGCRRPMLIAGITGALICSAAMGLTNSIPLLVITWCLTQLFSNAAISALIAVVPDRVPPGQRAQVSALYGMSANVAIFAGSSIVALTGTDGAAMFIWPFIFAFAAVSIFVVFYDDRPTHRAPARPLRLRAIGAAFWLSPRRHPDFAWAWLSRFMVYLGTAILMTYQVYYLRDALGFPPQAIGQKMLLSTLGMTSTVIAISWLAGLISDRLRVRKPFVLLSGVIYALGVLLVPGIGGFSGLLSGVIISSIGLGIYLAVDQALVVDILPGAKTDAAKNMGIINIANAVPQSVAPAIGPLFLAVGSADHQNYTALFISAAFFALAGATAVIPIKGTK